MKQILLVLMFLGLFGAISLSAQESTTDTLDQLFADLAAADENTWQDHQQEIWDYWSLNNSDTAELLLQRGREALSDGNVDYAVDYLTDLIELEPDFAEAWNARATAYFLQEEYGRSLDDIQHTLALQPRHFGAYSGLAIILERLEKTDEALQAYRQALMLNPHLPGAKDAVERLEKEVEGQAL